MENSMDMRRVILYVYEISHQSGGYIVRLAWGGVHQSIYTICSMGGSDCMTEYGYCWHPHCVVRCTERMR